MSCGSSSKSVLSSGSGMADVPVLMAGKHYILAASRVVGGLGDNDNDDKVSDPVSSCMARWLTPESCSSTRGPMSPSALAAFLVVPSFSILSN